MHLTLPDLILLDLIFPLTPCTDTLRKMKPRYIHLYIKRFVGRYILLIVASLGLILFIYFGTGSTELNCQRLKLNHVACQFKYTHLYGLIQDQSKIFYLFDAKNKTEPYGCGSEDTRENARGTCYRYIVFLESSIGEFSLQDLSFGSDSLAQKEINKIRLYIHGLGSQNLQFAYHQSQVGAIFKTIALGIFLLLIGWLFSLPPT
jgi:hypothetical protein